MLYPDVLGDVEVKKEDSAEKFAKTGWTSYCDRFPQYGDFPILEMRDGWKSPNRIDWISNYNPTISARNVHGLYWRSVPKVTIDPSVLALIRSQLTAKPN